MLIIEWVYVMSMLASHTFAGPPQLTKATNATSTLTDITSLDSCRAACETPCLQQSGSWYLWTQSRYNAIVTAATVSEIINNKTNTTRTTTITANYTLPASLMSLASHLTPPKDAVLINSTHVAILSENDLYASTTTTLTIPFRTNIALTPDTIQWSGIIPTTSMGLLTCLTHTSYQTENLPSLPTPSTWVTLEASGDGYLNLDQDPFGWTWYYGQESFFYEQSELSHEYPNVAALQNGTCHPPPDCATTLVSPQASSIAALFLTITTTGYESGNTLITKPLSRTATETKNSASPATAAPTLTSDSKPASTFEPSRVDHTSPDRSKLTGNRISSPKSETDSLTSSGSPVFTTNITPPPRTVSSGLRTVKSILSLQGTGSNIDKSSSAASHIVSRSVLYTPSSAIGIKGQTKPTAILGTAESAPTGSHTLGETYTHESSASSGISFSGNLQSTEIISSTVYNEFLNDAPDGTSLPKIIAPDSPITNGASSKISIPTVFVTDSRKNSQTPISDSITPTTAAPYLTLEGQVFSPIITSGRTAYSIAPDILVTADGSGYDISLASSVTALLVNSITTPVSAISQGDISLLDLTVNGNVYTPTSISGSLAYSIGAGSVLLPGGPTITLSGSTYSLAPSGTALIVNGVTSALSEHPIPSADPLILNGDTYTPTFVSSTAEYSIAPGQTLIPGASALTLSGQTISLDPDASRLIINGQTSTLSAPTKTTLGPGLGSYIASGFAGPTGTGSNPQEFTGAGSPEVNRRFLGWIVCCVAIVSLCIVLW